MTAHAVYDEATGDYNHTEVSTDNTALRSSEAEFIEQEDGSFRHQYQDVDHSDELSSFNSSEYYSALVETQPELMDAIKWASKHAGALPDRFGQSFDAAINSNDFDQLHSMIDCLLDIYEPEASEESTDETVEHDESPQIQEWYDNLSNDEIQAEVDEIEATDYSEDQIHQMAALSEQFSPGGVHQAILEAGVDVATHGIELNDAIGNLVENYGEANVAFAYQQLKQFLNQ